jgi:hypothetical protein
LILVADDDPDVSIMLADVLRMHLRARASRVRRGRGGGGLLSRGCVDEKGDGERVVAHDHDQQGKAAQAHASLCTAAV